MTAPKMNSIATRMANDSADAHTVSNAMQSLDHVDVVSVVCRHPAGEWYVFAKYSSELVTASQINSAINAARIQRHQLRSGAR